METNYKIRGTSLKPTLNELGIKIDDFIKASGFGRGAYFYWSKRKDYLTQKQANQVINGLVSLGVVQKVAEDLLNKFSAEEGLPQNLNLLEKMFDALNAELQRKTQKIEELEEQLKQYEQKTKH